MCNEFGNHVSYDQYIAAFSQLRLPLFVKSNGPDLSPRNGIHIRDTAPIVRRAGDGVELTELAWAPRDRNKKPVFNFRSEGRRFGKAARCLIPASHFYEFTAPKDARQKQKTKWRFTLAGADWFCIAGLVRPDSLDGADCFTMLTTVPGPDVRPYHDRQVAVLQPEDWRAWLDLERSEAEILRPLASGSLDVAVEQGGPKW
jgi:putative SOS response-associated peptidase YedK